MRQPPGKHAAHPVGDLAQHMIAVLCFMVQNGYALYDDINGEQIPGLERFSHLVNLEELPLELHGDLHDNRVHRRALDVLLRGDADAAGHGPGRLDVRRHRPLHRPRRQRRPDVPGLGFRYDTDERWPLPTPRVSRVSSRATARPTTPTCGPLLKPSPSGSSARWALPSRHAGSLEGEFQGRASAEVHSEEFKECVALQAQHIYDRFGKFPGTVPSMFILTYLQAHHLDLEFYDHHFGPGAYLKPTQTTCLAGIQKGAGGKDPKNPAGHPLLRHDGGGAGGRGGADLAIGRSGPRSYTP